MRYVRRQNANWEVDQKTQFRTTQIEWFGILFFPLMKARPMKPEKNPIRKATLLQSLTIVGACFASTIINKVIVPVILLGAPGLGKTALCRLLGKQLPDNEVILIIPSQTSPIEEMQSRPETTEDKRKKLIKFYSDLIPFDRPVLIIVDEYADLNPIDAAIFRALLFEHKWGDRKLFPGSYVIATGNLPEHNASALEIPTQSRDAAQIIHVRGDARIWLDHFAYPNGLDPTLCSFVEFRLSMDEDIVADGFNENDYASGCTARSLHQLSSLMTTDDGRKSLADPITEEILINGQLGQAIGAQFRMFRALTTIDPNEILAKPDSAPEPQEIGETYALIGLLSSVAAQNSNAAKILTYATRWANRPLACHLVETCLRRNKSLVDTAFHKSSLATFGDLTF